jgi:predicted nucleic acid-binding protein
MSGGTPDDIHLDTSFLIRALAPGSTEAAALRSWLGDGRAIAISTLVWGELLCGPLDGTSERLARRVVPAHVPLGTDEAAAAAALFNATGRRRGSFQDCIVAATAMGSGAALATSDVDDFGRLVSHGLKLATDPRA